MHGLCFIQDIVQPFILRKQANKEINSKMTYNQNSASKTSQMSLQSSTAVQKSVILFLKFTEFLIIVTLPNVLLYRRKRISFKWANCMGVL